MNITECIKKYRRIAGIEKNASLGGVPRKLGPGGESAVPRGLGPGGTPGVPGRRRSSKQDPAYVFLNSGRLEKILLPRKELQPIVAKKEEENKEEIKDMLGHIIGPREIYG